MKIRNVCGSTYEKYWDEGNWNRVPWFRKGKCKKIYRKKSIRKQLKELARDTEI